MIINGKLLHKESLKPLYFFFQNEVLQLNKETLILRALLLQQLIDNQRMINFSIHKWMVVLLAIQSTSIC